jgi:5-methylcytosine-specific restriction protein A
MSKNKTYLALIHSTRWLALRRSYITMHPLCEECRRQGITRPATEVHHVRPIEGGGTEAEMTRRAFDPTNLRALCTECHHAAHRHVRTRVQDAVKAEINTFFARFTKPREGE